MSRVMWRIRGYHGTGGIENNLLASISWESEEELTRFSPGSVVWLIREHFPLIPPTSMPPPTSPTSNPSTLTPTPIASKIRMASSVKLLIFKGARNEERGRFWFMIKSVWNSQGITNDNIKKATLVSVFQHHSLTWYMKYSRDHPTKGITTIKNALNKEFGNPKLGAHSAIGFKDIVMMPRETPWNLDQTLKSVICEANMKQTNEQHCTWFMASLTPHLRMAMSKQKISTQAEALETAMRIHKTPIPDPFLGV